MKRTLFLAWQDKCTGAEGEPGSRRWFPIGQLDWEDSSVYRFRYTQGANMAREMAGFQPLDAFPEFGGDYRSKELFSLFRNRVPNPQRGDYRAILERLALHEGADPFEILAVSGGNRQTDNLEVFPKIKKKPGSHFVTRFFLHGWRHVSEAAQKQVEQLKPGGSLRVAVELNNPASGLAVQLQSEGDYHMLGWAPRYLVRDLLEAVAESTAELSAHVVRINPAPAPHNQRVLIEFSGSFSQDFKPMDSPEFQPLVA